MRRRLTFPAKLELFHGRGLKGRLLAWFLRAVGQVPMDRSGGRASAGSMDSVLQVLRDGKLLGIYPGGHPVPGRPPLQGQDRGGPAGAAGRRAGHPGGRDRHRARAVGRFPKVPTMRRPLIRIGEPLDFSAYADAGNDREVLRWVTDQIMDEVMRLSGQEYVDAYGASVKAALAAGRAAPAVGHRPARRGPAGAARPGRPA